MSLSPAQRALVVIGTAAGACAIAVPAALGLAGNPSFSQRIPVRVPSSAHLVTADDHGSDAAEAIHRHKGRHEATRRHDDPTTSATPRGTEPEPGDDRGRGTEPEPGDDRGRGTEPEPGDDRGDDRGGDRGSVSGGSDDGGSDTGSGGSDDGSGEHGDD